MNIFIIGTSGTGKTPFATRLTQTFGHTHITSSAWVRTRFRARETDETRDAYTQAITDFSINLLRNDPLLCISYMREHNDLSKNCVIEGVRNPLVFFQLFDARHDIVILLNYTENPLKKTAFEEGVDVIAHYLSYAVKVGLVTPSNVVSYAFGRFFTSDPITCANTLSLEECINDFSRRMSITLE